MPQLLSLGELLIDFTPTGTTQDGRMLFARNPGGAPANVAVQALRAGVSSGFIGRVGKDLFGDFLAKTLRDCGVDTTGLSQDETAATTLAFVQLSETGDRDFSFYRNPGADTQLCAHHIPQGLIEQCELLCFGSLLLTNEPSRATVTELVKRARTLGKVTAYDPNWRPPLWKDEAEGVAQMRSLIPYADIMKVSDEELALLTEKTTVEDGAADLLAQGVSLVVVTLGAKGCHVFAPGFSVRRNTYDTRVIDTTASGDSFFGAFLARVIQSGKAPSALSETEIAEFVEFANASGAVCASRSGAISALPVREDIEQCRREVPLLVLN